LPDFDHLHCQVIEMPSQSTDRTAKARAALQRKFLDQAGGDREEAARLRRVFYQELQRRSVAVRRARAAAASRAERAELAALADELGIPSEAELLLRCQRELSAPDGSL
jgi:hypothetical protein